MSRRILLAVYIVLAVVVCPLLAWNVAVAAADHGFGARGFVIPLLAVPMTGAVLAAAALRRRRRDAVVGSIGALTATFVLVVALVFVTLAAR